ncbi:replicative DNA helicase [Antribacter gilvus]|uniref:replicative DNA helicase n=1 Tax=Antribacter gilvus TaxID=2304675 RepID=UPI000F77297E|nr:DnaB-like helicase C-terminal domain-containing protein [Antribacter gilvus]
MSDTARYADQETAIVGLAMRDATVIDDAHLVGADFAAPQLGALWDLMTRLRRDGQPCDPATVVANLGRLEVRGIDAADVAALYGDAPGAGADHYAGLVSDAATRRRLAMSGLRVQQIAEAADTAAEAVEMARAEIDACSRSVAGLHMLGDEIRATLERLDHPDTAIPTPWADLNHLIGGLRPGRLYIVGARPGVGKSLMANGLAVGLSAHGGVAVNNLEMSRHEVHERLLSAESGVPLSRIITRRLDGEHRLALAAAEVELERLPISIDDRAFVSITDVRSHARSLSRSAFGLSGVIVDYLQLMSTPRGDKRPRHEVVGDMSRGLKVLAKELDVPVVALSQLNRGSEARTDKRPTMADLRESGNLEQDADVIVLLHVEEDDPTTMHVAVAKNRSGMTGVLKLRRQGSFARLDNPTWAPARGAA